ncbi:MAG: hypothetical protein HY675_18045 [Chloroflexi bacterium]|nr:hypothetical protein [Chloroflexota bacterium]
MLFGGENATGHTKNDLHIWNPNGNDWAAVAPANSPPPPRAYHTSWQSGDKTYIVGGKDANGDDLKDLWFYGLTTDNWQRGPDARFPLAMPEH